MLNKSKIPNGLTSIRFIAAPLFFYAFLNGLFQISVFILVLAGITDVLDGYMARKMDVTSNIGSYLDLISDFVLIITCFLAYIIRGWYDPLILILIVTMFILFIGTSGLQKPVYDSVGKYLGAYLMVMIFISLLFPEPYFRQILVIILIILCVVSVINRFMLFLHSSEDSEVI